MKPRKLPILVNGQELAQPIDKRQPSSSKEYPQTYDESKINIFKNLENVEKIYKNDKNHKFLNEIILSVKLHEGFKAKSYFPTIFEKNGMMESVGGRSYKINKGDKETDAKLYFFRTTLNKVEFFKDYLIKENANKTEKQQITSVREIGFLSNTDKMFGFDSKWEEGRVEIVIHPLTKELNKIDDIIKKEFNSREGIVIKHYENGPTFITGRASKKVIENLVKYNFLRTIHPLNAIEISQPIRGGMDFKLPKREFKLVKSEVTVGVFDGGVDEENPLLKGLVIKGKEVPSSPQDDLLSHGTGVCGAILYGPLNNYNGVIEKAPKINVESFRVLPQLDSNDSDLYEVIDLIEDVVSSRDDIKVYNISLGPRGPIFDDQICRFTYAIDKLTYEKDVLFCIAVGNDGNQGEELGRIQAPSDAVNSLAIGSYTYNYQNEKEWADYSCMGIGREGAKIKPDILAFGGSVSRPFLTLGYNTDNVQFQMGTSLASPVVAGVIGSMMAYSKEVTPQLAKALVILNSKRDREVSLEDNKKLGYGYFDEEAEGILECSDNNVTILYNGEIKPTKNVKLPIPLPILKKFKGNIKLSWVLTMSTSVDALDSDGYTKTCIESTFYPHSYKYVYKNNSNKRKTIDIRNTDDITAAFKLGYNEKSNWPNTKGSRHNKIKEEKKAREFTWDTVMSGELPSMKSTSLCEPYLILHGLDRKGEKDKIKYALALKIEAINHMGSLYDCIREEYKILSPISLEIKIQNEIQI